MKRTSKLIAAGVGTLALAGGIGAGVSYAAGPTPGPTGAPTASPTAQTPKSPANPKDGARKGRALLARALHGEVTLAGPKHRVVDFQRGTVEAVSATSVTVQSKDGFSATYVLGSHTVVFKAGVAATAADIQSNHAVRVLAVKDGTTLTAQRIGLPRG
jgi:hypothetical protein